jgi:acylphosphatase
MSATKHMDVFQQTVRVRAHVTGRVQGVYYRAETRKQASQLGLTGWVRNLPDGRVEILAEGEEQSLRQLIAWCRQGPPRSRVDLVEEFPEEYTGEYDSFEITF